MRCPRCGRELAAGSRFCNGCGQPLAPTGATQSFQPAPTMMPAAVPAAAAAAPGRRLLVPLVICVVLLLLAIVGLGIYWAKRGQLTAAGHGNPNPSNLVVATPNGLKPAPITPAAPPGPISPLTPTPQPVPTPSQVQTPPQAQPQGMPRDVEAYLRWLAQVDISRAQMEKEAENATTQLLPELLTGGMGIDADTNEQNPLAKHVETFNRWSNRLRNLSQAFTSLQGLPAEHFESLQAWWNRLSVPGAAHVPSQCGMLHSYYSQALGMQKGAADEIAAAMAARQIDRVTKQMQTSRDTQGVLERADSEFSAVCTFYKVPQFYHIQIVPGTTPLPPVLPH